MTGEVVPHPADREHAEDPDTKGGGCWGPRTLHPAEQPRDSWGQTGTLGASAPHRQEPEDIFMGGLCLQVPPYLCLLHIRGFNHVENCSISY